MPSNQQKWRATQEGTLDGVTHATMAADLEEQVPDYMRRLPYSASAGDTLKFNHDRAPFDTREGRQAITFLINRWQNSHNAKDFVTTIEYPTGVSKKQREKYFGDSLEGFYKYGYKESKPEMAAEKLRAIGYTQEDGQWVDENGEQLQVNILTPGSGTWPLNAESAAQTLSDHGIMAQTVVKDKASFGNDVNQGNFQLTMSAWGAFGGGRHPYNYLSQEFGKQRNLDQNFDRTTIEVPYPVGDPDGDTQTVDIREKLQAIASASSEDAERAAIKEAMWVYNQSLPRIPLMNGVGRRWVNTRDWSWPPKESKWMRMNPALGPVRHGKVTPK
jgi:peptide/nickel transport system substrate-binding protein